MDRKHERNHGAYKESGFLRTKKNESNMTIWTSSKKKSSFYKNNSKVTKAESNILSEFYQKEIL